MDNLMSKECDKIFESLSKAQSEIYGAKEDSVNPFFKSKYADLSSIWASCREPLTKNNLSIVQSIDTINEKICVITFLCHASGQWIKSVLPVPLPKNDPQTLGSSITYCRRYALSALLNICPIDDDAEEVMKDFRKPKEYLSKEKYEELNSLLNEINDESIVGRMCQFYKVNDIYGLKDDQFVDALNYLNKVKMAKSNGKTRVA